MHRDRATNPLDLKVLEELVAEKNNDLLLLSNNAIYQLDSPLSESVSLREIAHFRATSIAHFQEIQDYSEIIITAIAIKDQNTRSDDWLLKRFFKKIFPSKL